MYKGYFTLINIRLSCVEPKTIVCVFLKVILMEPYLILNWIDMTAIFS